jgi:hypoxanthine-DNA glycosylase
MKMKACFPPVANKNAEILILGSMPGEKSLAENQYYAHPRNLFWGFMEMLLGIDSNQDYHGRLEGLKKNKIALWDVLKCCEREGSLDVNIKSEEANDLDGFLKAHSKISKICFNGQKSYSVFKKTVLKYNPDIQKQYRLIVLPSTSPANASISKDEKIRKWKTILQD